LKDCFAEHPFTRTNINDCNCLARVSGDEIEQRACLFVARWHRDFRKIEKITGVRLGPDGLLLHRVQFTRRITGLAGAYIKESLRIVRASAPD
jgi:hypothetical protein